MKLVANEVAVDLEDSVPPEHKDEAREAVAKALADGQWASPTVALAGAREGAVMLDGEMIDEASRKRAEELLARDRAVGGQGAGAPQ